MTAKKSTHAACGARLPAHKAPYGTAASRGQGRSGPKDGQKATGDWLFLPEMGWRRVDTVCVRGLLV